MATISQEPTLLVEDNQRRDMLLEVKSSDFLKYTPVIAPITSFDDQDTQASYAIPTKSDQQTLLNFDGSTNTILKYRASRVKLTSSPRR